MALDKAPKNPKEIRALPTEIEVITKEGETQRRTITGVIKFASESNEIRDHRGDTFVEELSESAFDQSLNRRDVVGLWSHRTDMILGNTKSGTLRIQKDKTELRFELDLPNTQAGNDAYEMIQRGDVDGVSFGMKVTKDKWSSEKRDGERIYKRSILDAELYEISPVAFPAYPSNEVNVRSLNDYREAEQRTAVEYRKRKVELELELL